MKMDLIGQWATYNMEVYTAAAFASVIKESRYLWIVKRKVISEKTFFDTFLTLVQG